MYLNEKCVFDFSIALNHYINKWTIWAKKYVEKKVRFIPHRKLCAFNLNVLTDISIFFFCCHCCYCCSSILPFNSCRIEHGCVLFFVFLFWFPFPVVLCVFVSWSVSVCCIQIATMGYNVCVWKTIWISWLIWIHIRIHFHMFFFCLYVVRYGFKCSMFHSWWLLDSTYSWSILSMALGWDINRIVNYQKGKTEVPVEKK